MKKIISVFLAVLMLVTMLPLSVFADEISDATATTLKGSVRNYFVETFLDIIGSEIHESFYVKHKNYSTVVSNQTGTYSTHFEDMNKDGMDELVIVNIVKRLNYDSYEYEYFLELICFYTGDDNKIYYTSVTVDNVIADRQRNYDATVYIENGFLYIYTYRTTTGYSMGNGRFSTVYSFDNKWHCEEKYSSIWMGVGCPQFVDSINNIHIQATMNSSPEVYKQIDSLEKEKQNKLKNTYKITQSKQTRTFTSNFIFDMSNYSWEVTGKIEQTFNKNKYIADIWLNRHPRYESTIENRYINGLLKINGNASSDLAKELTNNKKFYNSVVAWKTMEVVFSPVESTAELVYLDQNEIYQTLVFDLVKQTLSNEEYKEIISSQFLDAAGTLNKNFGTGSSILNNLNISSFETFKNHVQNGNIEIEQEYFSSMYASFKDTEQVFKNIDNFCFIANGIIKGVTTFNDFINKICMYYTAMQLSLEQSLVLKEMATHTSDSTLKDALKTIAAIAESDEFAQALLDATGESAIDMGVYITSVVADEFMKLIPIYGILKTVHEVSSAAINVLLNTDNIIDAYYLLLCTGELCYTSKKAISSLADKYISDDTELSAGAFIDSVKMYIKMIDMDLQTYCKFVKAASEDGLYNLSKKVDNQILSYFGYTTENTYDEVCESKDNILQSVDLTYDFIETSWVTFEDYLQVDYPTFYPKYAQEELKKRKYTPVITNIKLNKDGATQLQFGFIPWIDTNIEITEKTDDETMTYSFNQFDEILCSNSAKMNVFPKLYTARSFVDSESGRIYSNPSKTHSVNMPLATPKVSLPAFDNIMSANYGKIADGITIAISDTTNTYYDNVKYHIYRKTDTSDFTEIAVIDRSNLYNGKITTYVDKNITKGTNYSYKVQSEITFTNGVSAKSEFSDPIKMGNDAFGSRVQNINAFDLRTVRNEASPFARLAYRAVNEADNNENGIKISWDAAENAAGYEVYRKPNYGQIFNKIATVTTCEYIDTDVREGVGYDYLVVEFFGTEDNKVYGACSDTASIDYKSVSITAEKTKIYDDEVLQLSAVTYPADEAVQWSSDDTAIATVDKNGLVTAKSAGTVKIKAMLDNGIFDEIEITVVDKDESQILNPGDMNGDGKITASDARAVLRFSAKLDSPTDEQFIRADVNGDNRITAADARKILRVSAKLETL